MPTLIERLKLTNFLSFGPEGQEIELGPLNVLIGPNGSGKSNLLEAFALLQALPTDLGAGVRRAGGIRDLMWKGQQESGPATMEADVEYRTHFVAVTDDGLPSWRAVSPELNLRYSIEMGIGGTQQLVEAETVSFRPNRCLSAGRLLYEYEADGFAKLHGSGRSGQDEAVERISVSRRESILSQRKDPERYHQITYLATMLSRIRLYRDWVFGVAAPSRQMQPTDLSPNVLAEDTSNLALVINRIMGDSQVRRTILAHLQRFHPDYEEVSAEVIGGFARPFVRERGLREFTPATRLSDGTLRWLALLAVLCHPEPPPLVCIEEPELGLHPDIIHVLAELLREASERTQLIVTTHSDLLVSAFSDTPEAVIVCEKDDRGTQLQRLNADELKIWLEKYSLGELWLKGVIGGTRW
jgi:predicted ATPase